MNKFIFVLLVLPILSACGVASTTYNITIDNAEREDALLLASVRVIERRMENIGETIQDIDIRKNDRSQIYISVKEQSALDILSAELTSPFDFQIMEEAPENEAEKIVEGHGGFSPSGITSKDVLWLETSEEPGGKGRVTITLTENGRQSMADVFNRNVGKSIGIFVRGQLVSKLLVQTDELKDDIIITDIPSFTLANIFADDVNVGLHVLFSPIQ